jgi:NDP-sugar pyrophosphorylase family protein
MKVIILAGGLGTRLAAVVKDVPKPMAAVLGRPFLEHQLDYLAAQGIQAATLAVSHKRDIIQNHFGAAYRGLKIDYAIEHEPLGTGGAIKQALGNSESALVLNGDTYFPCDLAVFLAFHQRTSAALSVGLTHVENTARYGAVTVSESGQLTGFVEKAAASGAGLINAGVYVLSPALLSGFAVGEKFSFESEILQKRYAAGDVYGLNLAAPFIDIGIPEDYERAQGLLAQ